jgi:hypothetical protein
MRLLLLRPPLPPRLLLLQLQLWLQRQRRQQRQQWVCTFTNYLHSRLKDIPVIAKSRCRRKNLQNGCRQRTICHPSSCASLQAKNDL